MRFAAILLIGVFASGAAMAQGPESPIGPGWTKGISVHAMGIGSSLTPTGSSLTPTLTARATTLPGRPTGAGVEFALSVFPEGLGQGIGVFMLDLGPVVSTRNSDMIFLGRAGVSGVLGVSGSGAGGAAGGYVGAGTILRVTSGLGLRLDVERRFFLGLDPGTSLFMFGLGVTTLPGGGGGGGGR